MGTRKPSKPYPAELRERAVRLARAREAAPVSQPAAIRSISGEVGCNAEALRPGVRQAGRERARGQRAGPTTGMRGSA